MPAIHLRGAYGPEPAKCPPQKAQEHAAKMARVLHDEGMLSRGSVPRGIPLRPWSTFVAIPFLHGPP